METQESKLIYVEEYLKKYFDKWLIKDIEMIKKKNLKFTLPYILLVNAGIDFLGGLTEGFSTKPGVRSRNFIKDWMSKADDLYKAEGMSDVIWGSVRCGSSHQAIYKKGVECSYDYPRCKHLHLNIRQGYDDRVIIQALQFADDFVKAQNLYRNEYIHQNIDAVYKNLIDMIREKKEKNLQIKFDILIGYLRANNFTFKDENECFVYPLAAPNE